MSKPEDDDDLGFTIMRAILRRHKKEHLREVLLALRRCCAAWPN